MKLQHLLPINILVTKPVTPRQYTFNRANYGIHFTGEDIIREDTFESHPSGEINEIEEDKTIKEIKPVNLQNGLNISGIHCPACGCKMLSQEDFEKISYKASLCKTPIQLMSFLNSNREYIHDEMNQIFIYANNIKNLSTISMEEFYNKLKLDATLKKAYVMHDTKNVVSEILKDNPHQDIIQKTISGIDKDTSFYQYYDLLKELMNTLELDFETNRTLRESTLGRVYKTRNYARIFDFNTTNITESGQYAQRIAYNIFKESLPTINKIQTNEERLNDPENTVLLCSACDKAKSKFAFWSYKPDFNKLHDSIKLYLGDIALLTGQNKIEASKRYLDYFAFVSNILSKQKTNISKDDISHISNLIKCAKRRETFAPIAQDKVDIPCAQCGSTMTPQSVRTKIEDDIKKCSTPYEYYYILKKYDKYIGKYTSELTSIFKKIVEENPNISENEFLVTYRDKINNYCREKLELALQKYLSKEQYYIGTEQEEEYFEIAKKIRKYIDENKFTDYIVKNLLSECFRDTENMKFKAAYSFIKELKKIFFLCYLTQTDKPYAANDPNPIHTIVFQLFTSNVATGDHLVAKSKGGDSSKDNTIGLCRMCNKLKSSYDVFTWYFHTPSVNKNLYRQLKVVDGMAKAGQLDGYDTWAHDMSETLYEQTYGFYDIRKNFPLPKKKEEK